MTARERDVAELMAAPEYYLPGGYVNPSPYDDDCVEEDESETDLDCPVCRGEGTIEGLPCANCDGEGYQWWRP